MSKNDALRAAINTLKLYLKTLEPYSVNWIGVQAVILNCESALEKWL